ncbi:ATP synthase F1 subcomplex gamma subunit [Phyllobacterium sp. YR620]|jgi:F-type H+-transporting ATPase subunit gamma|uniref:ATP synthase gamma chain n=1 Tax=Phyllobacterium pellucidum TaxID=2740464 RepID=A0A849VXL4_9HYPH|nr:MULTISPECIES: F0F1 ATP synthase subunit gamma [Phyllobacterium]MRG54881.1 F0F1 ATP synthase subunit gamma [Phyllobacterium sp. SYP-B3895]NTS32553.1 F0F1 ATP synthase subunit gamma [Phyllobacterium pellucidum]UGY09939.1 F0F1 ATP synthase subunit gamma [Phyllobacterium sp. T1018]SDP40647.1 ATP synthase F1 subcomplex gamma subunit [Phyllobacterium sp. YR620]SFI77483.1 ATP synthase F1 subcomplex gamma subunit [Phyllobacterium sp. CL33Tsu]
MPSLKDLRNRIASVKATQKITKAMQMVAAAKLRRAQDAALAARPYSQRMAAVLANIASNVDGADAPVLMSGTGKDDVHLLVVCTSERGLCGGFNAQIVRLARDHARRLIADGKTVKILTVGKKGADILRRDLGRHIIDHVDLREVKQVGFANADAIGHKIIALYNEGGFDVATLFYSEFKSVIAQIPTAQQLIPANSISEVEPESAGDAVYEYEPDPASILGDLIPRNISVQVFRALLENAASEQGARMSAMDNATRNAGDMINKLTMSYNRQRQAQITKELIEIISGAEAL